MTDPQPTTEVGTSNTPIQSPSTTPFATPTSHPSGDESSSPVERTTDGLRSSNIGKTKQLPASRPLKATASRSAAVESPNLPSPSSDGYSNSDTSSSVEIITDSAKSTTVHKAKPPYAIPPSLKVVAAKMGEKANYNYHMSLLSQGHSNGSTSAQHARLEELRTTPLFAASVMAGAGDTSVCSSATNETKILFPQYGLLAQNLATYDHKQIDLFDEEHYQGNSTEDADSRIFLNINTPWSAFICGSQGSGKSHTLSCMLENSLLPSQLGALPKPLAAIVFHYDKFTSFSSSQICEAAYLCSSGIPVRVLVSPSNFWRMQHAYSNMPGLPANAKKPVIAPMLLKERHLDIERMMNLMAVSEKDGPMPLYMEVGRSRLLKQ